MPKMSGRVYTGGLSQTRRIIHSWALFRLPDPINAEHRIVSNLI